MSVYRYRLVNVFAESRLAGNALCVFEDARGLSDAQMQALALQFNLSETTFLLPSERASARVRIFAPRTEYPFAGHPTLGSAAVLRDMRQTGTTLSLETNAGVIPITFQDDVVTLKANAPSWKPVETDPNALAAVLGVRAEDILHPVLWMNTGFEQLLIPMRTKEAVASARINPALTEKFSNQLGLVKIYLWAEANPQEVVARFFFTRAPGQIGEDPGTGSACANLGGWLLATKAVLPRSLCIHQGDHLGRPSRLHLHVDAAGGIFVGGKVVEIGSGSIEL